ncbi:hypothetical protein [Leifsonia sp. WHRI 6310E]|uniref:hypothetical protein n=1 Tax=Leifsonia sp. WHRI 6310E TaxID=3162562 RepID=UPI0032ED731F
MFFWPRKKVVVSLTDGTALTAVTLLSVRALRLRDVEASTPRGEISVTGKVIVPAYAVLTVQVMR